MRFLLLLLLTGCLSQTAKLTPQPSRQVVTYQLSDEIISNSLPHHLTWDWMNSDGNTNFPMDGVEFDLEYRLSMDPNEAWALYCRTNQPPVFFDYTNSQEFFRLVVHFTGSNAP